MNIQPRRWYGVDVSTLQKLPEVGKPILMIVGVVNNTSKPSSLQMNRRLLLPDHPPTIH